jgi:galactokinase
VDHQGGAVLGRTIQTGTLLAFAPLSKPEVRLYSDHFGEICFPIGQPPDLQHWARYAQAAALALGEVRTLRRGLSGFLSGTLIGAGLSSSASVGLAYLLALAAVNDLTLTMEELVRLQYQLEHDLLGLQIGILDPATITQGQENALLHIDTISGRVTPIPDSDGARNTVWLIAYSGVSRQLTQSGYNNRVAECYEAASLLQPGAKRLSDVPRVVFDENQHILQEHLRRRATHFYSEVERVHDGRQAWGESDLGYFGALMNASCESSIRQYESGSPVIIDLYYIVRDAPGVYGCRFSGGGYAGCVVGLARREQVAEAVEFVTAKFAGEHPELADHAAVYVMENDGGLRFAETA